MYRILIFLLPALVFVACNTSDQLDNTKQWIYRCNAETVSSDGKKFIDEEHSALKFTRGDLRTKENSFKGEYALKLTDKQKFGFSTSLKFVKPNEFFKVTVWKKAETEKGVVVASTNGFYRASNQVVETAENGWVKLELTFFVPPNIREDLKIYVWNNGNQTAYFDELEIIRSSERQYPQYDLDNSFKIYYTEKANQKLQGIRRNSFDHGNIIVGDDDYISSIIFTENDYLEAKMRIKGDWLDHIQGDKLSFRIKAKGNYAWNGMKVFSIQTPEARNFQHEWVLHQMLLNDDLLTTRFGFIPTYVNGKSRGIYAWEEHFDKQLIESSNRREGPIIRFNESIFWETVRLHNTEKFGYDTPFYDAATINPFKSGHILKSPLLYNEFLEAQSLLYQLQIHSANVSELFDIEKYTDFVAYNLLNEAYHGLAWHNIRYYYNPVLCKLEPITYDGNYHEGAKFDDLLLIGAERVEETDPINRHNTHFYLPLRDTVYLNSIYKSIKKVTDPNFINNYFNATKDQLFSDEKLLQDEFPRYTYSNKHVLRNAEKYRALLPTIQKNINSKAYLENTKAVTFKKINNLKKFHPNLDKMVVQIYQTKNQNGELTIQVKNFTIDTIQIISGMNNGDIFDSKFDKIIKVPPMQETNETTDIVVPKFYESYYANFPSANETTSIASVPWPAPGKKSSRQIIEASINFPQTNFYKLNEKEILFNGNITINKNVIIPKGYKVIIKPGTKIDLTDSSTFVSYSPVFVLGTKENPITVTSSDQTSKGFNVIQAKQKSKLQYATFDGLSNLQFQGWITPCAVCFYESDVDMNHVTFARNINCDDALNVVRSHFNVDRCKFIETNSDAFDSDFCTGTLSNSEFDRPGNDAIDFSGSVINISGCTIEAAGDKGVSGGEGSTLYVANTVINNSNIGIASKDKSLVTVENSKITNCVYGLSAYVKKPEYGAAQLEIKNVDFKKNMFLHLIEEKSTLIFNNKKINGTARNVAERFY